MTTNLKTSSAVKVLMGAKEGLETKGWIQHNYRVDGLGFCLAGAVIAASDAEDGEAAFGLLRQALPWRPYVLADAEGAVIEWNDEPGRTKEEVLDLVARAIALGVPQP